MKNISLGLIILTVVLSIAPSTLALTPRQNRTSPGAARREVKENIKEDVREKREGVLDKVKDFMKRNLRFAARVRGKITAIQTNSFSISGGEGTFQINITDQTQISRKFGGKSNLSEYSVGDEVTVIGKFTDETKTAINAKIIRNLSIQKRRGAFFGKVTIINSDNFIMETSERGTQTVYFGTAKIVDRREKSISYGDIKIGDRVRVKGLWDKKLNQISEVNHIKDFSIPAITPTKSE